MLMLRIRIIRLLVISMLLSACANQKPFEYHSSSEIPQGAGMVSGEDGAFVLYSKERKDAQSQSVNSSDAKHFEAWQKKAKSKGGEYNRHFQEWLEYQRWRKQQGN